jgi:hypothetical protein
MVLLPFWQTAVTVTSLPDGTWPLRVPETLPSYPGLPEQGEPHVYGAEVPEMTV